MKRPLRTIWPLSTSRPLVSPLQSSVVYAAEDADALDAQYEGRAKGYTYSREGHPNAEVVARLIDGLEGASGGTVTSSGMAAVTIALLAALKSGDHAIGADQLYGRSLRLMSEELPRLGIATSLVDPTDAGAVETALRPETKLILIETVSNPTLRLADIPGILQLARTRGLLVAIDNTFATPAAYRPFEHGADIVIHSVTKLLSGHSDAMLGYVAAKDPDLNQRIADLAATLGVQGSPFDCWLAERGLYSFDMRFERASANAARLADVLQASDKVSKVFYPLRQDHPDHNRAAALLGDKAGHMVSFVLEGGRGEVNSFIRALDGIAFAPTLGDIATTVSHPASSSHRAMSAETRAGLGMPEGFIRVSVGCEPPEHLEETFRRALS